MFGEPAALQGNQSFVNQDPSVRQDLHIDRHHHALLTMADGAGLPTIEPDRLSVVDHDGEDGHLGGACSDRHEARLDASDVGHDLVDRHARLSERGLGNGVVLKRTLSETFVGSDGGEIP